MKDFGRVSDVFTSQWRVSELHLRHRMHRKRRHFGGTRHVQELCFSFQLINQHAPNSFYSGIEMAPYATTLWQKETPKGQNSPERSGEYSTCSAREQTWFIYKQIAMSFDRNYSTAILVGKRMRRKPRPDVQACLPNCRNTIRTAAYLFRQSATIPIPTSGDRLQVHG